MKNFLLALFSFFICHSVSFAQDGVLDTSFGNQGIVYESFGEGNNYVRNAIEVSEGKIWLLFSLTLSEVSNIKL